MFGIIVLHITSLSTNEIGRYLTPKEILQKGSRPHVEWYCCPARWVILLSRTLSDIVVPHVGRYCCPARGTVTIFSVRVCISYSDSDVIYTHIHTRAIEGLRGFAKGLRPFELRSLIWRWHGPWPGSERSFGWSFFFTSDQNTALIDRKLMAYKTLRF